MPSIALAVTPGQDHAGQLAGTMLAAMKDRSPEWAVSAGTVLAVGAGAADRESAGRMIAVAPESGVMLVSDVPAWERRPPDPILTVLAGSGNAATPDAMTGLLSQLRGDAHVAVTIGSDACVAYRGAMSGRPLFYATGVNGSLFVASQIRGILSARPDTVSSSGLAPFLVPQLCDRTGTAWSGIWRLPPGHALIWRDGKLTVTLVSEVEPADSAGASRAELVAEFRRRLLSAVERASGPPDGILLSGGIDSSSLACAYSIPQGHRGPARGYALTYDQDLAACDERRFVDDVERATAMAVSRLPGNRLLPLVAASPEGDEPEPWAYAARNWGLLRHIAADQAQATATLLAGEGGDELLLGQVLAVADRLARGDAGGASAEIRTFPDPARTERVVQGLLRGEYDRDGARAMRALGDVPAWLTGRYIAETGIVDRLAAGYPWLGSPGTLTASYSRGVLGDLGAAGRVMCGGWWEDMGRKAGLAITYPFLDPDLAALSWALPPDLLRGGGLEKVVLREALSDVLPESVARRADKADALALMHAGLKEKIATVRKIAAGGPLADQGVIEPARLLSSIDRYLAGDLSLAPALWATAAVDQWLATRSLPPAPESGVLR